MVKPEQPWFSEREKARPFAERIADREVPGEFGGRVAIVLANLTQRLIERVSEYESAFAVVSRLYAAAFGIPDVRQTFPMLGSDYTTESYLEHLEFVCRKAPWYAVFGICEACYQALAEEAGHRRGYEVEVRGYEHEEGLKRPAYQAELTYWERDVNDLLAEFGLPWVFRNGEIRCWFPEPLNTQLEEARSLLMGDARFKGPDEQFGKAIGFLSRRPEPDEENCVKEAATAVEGVARIVSGDHAATLGEILKKYFKSRIPPGLFKAFEGVWGYANNAPGARHAKVGAEQLPIEEAEFVLHTCAAMILYLVKLDGATP